MMNRRKKSVVSCLEAHLKSKPISAESQSNRLDVTASFECEEKARAVFQFSQEIALEDENVEADGKILKIIAFAASVWFCCDCKKSH